MITALPRQDRLAEVVALAAIVVALAIKPWTLAGFPVLVATGIVAVLLEPRWRPSVSAIGAAAMVAGGFVVFLAGRGLGPPIGVRLSVWGILAIIMAAVTEEAFFRGVLFSRIASARGVGIALAVTSILFALVHVPTYGWVVVPIDLAAGAVFGWQRVATGSWLVPALTHLSANLLQMG